MRALIALLLLTACASPAFLGAPAQRMEVGGMTFSVRVREDEAEAMRTSVEMLPRERDAFARATVAIEQASGCTVRQIDGDAAIVRAKLAC